MDAGTILPEKLVEEGTKAELHTANIYGTYYCQVFKGYFYAKYGGEYTFRGASDDSYDMYMSDEAGTATINPIPIISESSVSGNIDNYYISNRSSATGIRVL